VADTPEVGVRLLAILSAEDALLRLHLRCVLLAEGGPPHHLHALGWSHSVQTVWTCCDTLTGIGRHVHWGGEHVWQQVCAAYERHLDSLQSDVYSSPTSFVVKLCSRSWYSGSSSSRLSCVRIGYWVSKGLRCPCHNAGAVTTHRCSRHAV
jgi:hypothetical protein